LKAERFVREYAHDLSNGGLFINGADHLDPLEEVEIEIDLPGLGTHRVLAEAAHVLTVERAQATGRRPGAGLAITQCNSHFREALHKYLLLLGRRKDLCVLVGPPACSVVLQETGYQVAPLPGPEALMETIDTSPIPIAGVVISRSSLDRYTKVALAAGVGDLIIAMDSVDEIDAVLTILDGQLER
jgi:hypothetical protein